jgi:HYDIN/CFA65/VesB family protein/List-Bact-rpt repeat protein
VIGTIHYAIPQLTLDPASLVFGNRVVGSVVTKTVTVSNTGGADLAIEGIGISSAEGGGFGQTSTCPPTLAIGSSCSIDVSFTPSSIGAAAATLAVTSNAPTGSDTVALSGVGITPPTHTLTVQLAGGGGGRVDGGGGAISCPSTCSHTFAAGAEVTLTAIPASGSTFAGWSGGGCAGTSACRVRVGSDTTVSAKFAKAPPAAARLRIAEASAKEGAQGPLISVRGTIAKGARGKVAVKARIRVHGKWVTVIKRAKIANGSWRSRLVLGRAVAPGSLIHLSASFRGSRGFHPALAVRQLRLR